jgi:hypothetical protein
MTKNPTDSLTTAQETIRRQDDLLRIVRVSLGPEASAVKALVTTPELQRLVETLGRQRDAMRAALGPLEELRRNGVLDRISGLTESAQLATKVLSDYGAHFALPGTLETAKLFKQFQESGIAAQMRRFREQGREIQAAMEAMRAPWLDVQNRLQSMGGFAELQSIGISMRRLYSFDENLTDQLRINLGDWRAAIKWPDQPSMLTWGLIHA